MNFEIIIKCGLFSYRCGCNMGTPHITATTAAELRCHTKSPIATVILPTVPGTVTACRSGSCALLKPGSRLDLNMCSPPTSPIWSSPCIAPIMGNLSISHGSHARTPSCECPGSGFLDPTLEDPITIFAHQGSLLIPLPSPFVLLSLLADCCCLPSPNQPSSNLDDALPLPSLSLSAVDKQVLLIRRHCQSCN